MSDKTNDTKNTSSKVSDGRIEDIKKEMGRFDIDIDEKAVIDGQVGFEELLQKEVEEELTASTTKEEREEIGLIQVERHFPKQVTISDAEYVFRGDPAALFPNPNPGEAYFAAELPDYCGVSGKKEQYNRSCTIHHKEDENEEEIEEEIPLRLPWILQQIE